MPLNQDFPNAVRPQPLRDRGGCCVSVIAPEANFRGFQGSMRRKFRQLAADSSMELSSRKKRIDSMEADPFATVFWDHRVRQRPGVGNIHEQRLRKTL